MNRVRKKLPASPIINFLRKVCNSTLNETGVNRLLSVSEVDSSVVFQGRDYHLRPMSMGSVINVYDSIVEHPSVFLVVTVSLSLQISSINASNLESIS